MKMNFGIQQGRVVETPFGRISDTTLNLGRYHLQMILLLVSIMLGKGFYIIGVFISILAITMYYQSPIARFLAWKRKWFAPYFYGHLVISVAIGFYLSHSQAPTILGLFWIFINIVFGWLLMKQFSGDFEELMNGKLNLNNY